jgi:hypothetical protein
VQRGRRLAPVADEAVGIVLEHGHVQRNGELHHAPAPLDRERAAARVLEGGNRVEEARSRAELSLELVRVEPVLVHRQRHHVGAEPREQLERTVVGRPLHDDAARPPREQLLEDEGDALQAAVGEDHARRLDAVARRQGLAQRPVAASRAVGEH